MFLLNSKIEVREFERASKNSSQPGTVLAFFVGETSLVEALCLLMRSSSSGVLRATMTNRLGENF